MRRHWMAATALLALMAGCGYGQRRNFDRGRGAGGVEPLANGPAEAKILGVLKGMVDRSETYLDVGESNGRLLRIFAESSGAKQVAEIGTSTGYSGLWLALALTRTGGHLTTFELDAGRAAKARAHFQAAGVDGLIRVVEGNAHANIKTLQGPLDLVFIDADKEGYADYLTQLLPLVRAGGIIVADNVDLAPDYITAVTRNPALETVFQNGMSITLKKR